MAEVLLFHHAHGLTPGVQRFAERLREAGHVVHVPDLFEGRTFESLEEGVGYAQEAGFDTIIERGRSYAEWLPAEVVPAGFSLGVLPVSEFGGSWPESVPVQIHGMDEDPFFAGEGDLEAARALVASAPDAELFLYPGKEHLFTDPGLPSYDEPSAELLLERVLAFLSRV
jgi:dienelactone hydrolase